MKKIIFSATAIAFMILASCSTSKQVIVPLNRSVELDDTYTIIWNGVSKAYRYENGQWLRAESYDYQFDVVQKRYDNHWNPLNRFTVFTPTMTAKRVTETRQCILKLLTKI